MEIETYLNGGVKHVKVTNTEPFANCVIRKFKWLVEEAILCYNMPARIFTSKKQLLILLQLILRRILSNMSLKQQNSHLYQVHQARVKWEACPLKYHNKVPNKHQSKISS